MPLPASSVPLDLPRRARALVSLPIPAQAGLTARTNAQFITCPVSG